MPLVTEAEIARALHRDQKAVKVAVRQGRITQRADGLFDLDSAIEEFQATTHHEKGHNNRSGSRIPTAVGPPGALPDIPAPEIPLPTEAKSTAYAKARAGTQIYEALLKKLRYEERAKNLTPTADVESARFTEFRTLREACFNIPSRISAFLAGESDVAKCQLMLEDELNKVFTAFADGKLDGKLAA
jgi:hypothetical protein